MKTRRKNKAPPVKSASTVLTFADKAKLIGIPLVTISIAAWIFISAHTNHQQRAIEKLVERWKAKYQLTDHQAAQLHKIEISFHGNGNPLIYMKPRTKDEVYEHHVIMSKVVDKEFAETFLADLERRNNRH